MWLCSLSCTGNSWPGFVSHKATQGRSPIPTTSPIQVGVGGKKQPTKTSRVRLSARKRRLASSGSRSAHPTSCADRPAPEGEKRYDWVHWLPIRPGSFSSIPLAAGERSARCRQPAPWRPGDTAEAAIGGGLHRVGSLPVRTATVLPSPLRRLSVLTPALPPWLPLCGVGRSWSSVSSYSATASPPPPRVRSRRSFVPQALGHQPGRSPTPSFRGRTPLYPPLLGAET